MNIFLLILVIVGAYLLGSIPTAVWIGRSLYGIDVREHGSGNAGATNTLRVLGNKAGFAVLLIDILKGFLAVMLVHLLPDSFFCGDGRDYLKILLAFMAVMGHTFPVFAGFNGGKGVATTVGAAIGIFTEELLIMVVVFVLIVWITRYISLGSIVCAILLPFLYYFFNVNDISTPLMILSIVIAVFIPVTHAKNIKRLLNGTESKFGFNKNNNCDDKKGK